jgi:alcohol dehydrogenase class IV
MSDRDPGFQQRTAVALGAGVVERLPRECARLGAQRPVVLIDAALADGPISARVKALLPDAPLVTPSPGEPSYRSVDDCTTAVLHNNVDGVVAVGGGSTIDTAKLLRGVHASDRPVPELPERFERKLMPLIAIPTTAGTGAELGAGAVVTDSSTGTKTLVRRQELAADVALADGDMTLSLPSNLTAYTGCDAFAQAFLAFVPAGEHSISGQLALEAMRTIHRTLPCVVERGDDRELRATMMRGSVLGAMAMFNAPPEYGAEHLFAEAVGGRLRVHHGHLVAAYLPATAELNQTALAPEFAAVARALGIADDSADDTEAVDTLIAALQTFVARVGVQPLRAAASEYPLDELVDLCLKSDAAPLNPVPLDRANVANVLRSGYRGGDWCLRPASDHAG